MLTLRLTQTSKGKDSYQVQANLAGEAFTPLTSTFSFSFGISEQDQEDYAGILKITLIILLTLHLRSPAG
jgi:hypothetical protein